MLGAASAAAAAAVSLLPLAIGLPAAPRIPVDAVMDILYAFEEIAGATPENARCVATGYNASAQYVLAQLGGEGVGDYFDVQTQSFVVPIMDANSGGRARGPPGPLCLATA